MLFFSPECEHPDAHLGGEVGVGAAALEPVVRGRRRMPVEEDTRSQKEVGRTRGTKRVLTTVILSGHA